MKKQYFIIVGAAIIVILLVVVMTAPTKDQSQDSTSVASDDGAVTLEIPAGALPETLTVGDVSITRAVPEDVVLPETFVVYDLKPSGIVFGKDVVLTFALQENFNNVIPRAFYITEAQEVEPVKDYNIALNTKTGETTVRLALTHFSRIALSARVTAGGLTHTEFFSATAEVPDTPVNSTVNGLLTIHKSDEPVLDFTSPRNGKQIGEQITPDSVTMSGSLSPDGSHLAPAQDVADRPPHTAFLGSTYTVPLRDFTCTSAGPTFIRSIVDLAFSQHSRYRDGNDAPWQESVGPGGSDHGIRLTITMPFTCIAPPVVEEKVSRTSPLIASADPEHFECPDAQLFSPTDGGEWVAIVKLNDGLCYPAHQFDGTSSRPDLCEEVHYHLDLRSLGGQIRPDSQPCGAAVESNIVKRGGGIFIQHEQKKGIEDYELGRALGNE